MRDIEWLDRFDERLEDVRTMDTRPGPTSRTGRTRELERCGASAVRY